MPWPSVLETGSALGELFPRHGFPLVSTTAHRDLGELAPADRAGLEQACAKRRGEFAAGRHCLRLALAALGVTEAPLPPDEQGAPRWPSGTVGSISHTRGMVVAVAARRNTASGLGVDVDDIRRPFPRRILPQVLRDEEQAELDRLPAAQRDLHAYASFCAKESVYKCVCTATGIRLRFTDVSLSLDLDRGTFVASFHRSVPPGWPPVLTGRVGRSREHVYSGLWWPPAAAPKESS